MDIKVVIFLLLIENQWTYLSIRIIVFVQHKAFKLYIKHNVTHTHTHTHTHTWVSEPSPYLSIYLSIDNMDGMI